MIFQKTSVFLALFVVLWVNISCSTMADESILSVQEITFEGEGGKTDVEIGGIDWRITGVINNDGNVPIYGKVFAPDGSLLRENIPVAMEKEGRIESKWRDKGFIITRNTRDAITVEVLENSTGEPFNFSVVIQGKNKAEEISVKQKVSEGYHFAGIDYFLRETDKDSLYYRENRFSYRFDIKTPVPFSFSPYEGVDICRRSYFESEDPNAFVWLKDDSVHVNIPQTIINNTIYYSSQKNVYGVTTQNDYLKENTLMVTVNLPSGISKFHTVLEWRKRVVSYKLTLINNRTKAERTVLGKWIEVVPTGNYKIVTDE